MDKSLWESLLDDINALKKKDEPSAGDAPRVQRLLRQVAELSGTARPAAPAAMKPAGDVLAGSSGSAMPAGGPGNEGKGIASEYSPPEPDPIMTNGFDKLESGSNDGNGFKKWYDPVATAQILPGGNITVDVNSTMPKRGATLPAGSVRIMGDDLAKGADSHVLRGLVAKPKDARTGDDLNAVISFVYNAERLKERDSTAFERLPKDHRLLFKSFSDKMLEERGAILPTGKDPTTRLPVEKWDELKRNAAQYALDSAYGHVLGTTFAKGLADTVPQLVGGINILLNADVLKEFEEKTREWNKSTFGVPKEYEGKESLYWAELAGNLAGTILMGVTPTASVKAAGFLAEKGGALRPSLRGPN